MTETSSWEAHRQKQRQNVIDREYQRAQRYQANKDYEVELRRRCAVQHRDRSPYEEDAREALSAARKIADCIGTLFSFRRS